MSVNAKGTNSLKTALQKGAHVSYGPIGSLLFAIVVSWSLASLTGVPREAAFMAGIFVAAAVLWMTEALPLFVTSLLVIGLQIILLANPGEWRDSALRRKRPHPTEPSSM